MLLKSLSSIWSMKNQSPSLKMWQWIAATAVSSVTAGITILTFIGNLVYTNAQGKALEDKVARLEVRLEMNEIQTRNDVAHIRNRIDEIYKILVASKR